MENGYHEIESVFAFLDGLYDIIELDLTIQFHRGSATIAGVADSDNSVKRAAEILMANFDDGVPHATVTKRLPICAGIGGGSSDAACFINAVFDHWSMPQQEKLQHINLFDPLGSDTKVFLYKYIWNCDAVYLLGTGIDGVVRRIDSDVISKDHVVVLVGSGTMLSTRLVYEAFAGPNDNAIGFQDTISQLRNIGTLVKHEARNSLKQAAMQLDPSIAPTLRRLEKTEPILYGMSGSGPTCFGIYKNLAEAQTAIDMMKCPFAMINTSSRYQILKIYVASLEVF
ncbi:MAG: hypothetical protein LBJ69_01585 [Holosporales bacterium]|jgi:4-diphosphocytidyl-2-C-methyl-D-erythritol kinase|nr:hypothetical protein [Holosporales bacterium]